MSTMTYEELVLECKRLRGIHERAEAEFFLFLIRAERELAEVWREAGCSDFAQFLRSNHLADTDRYRFFVIGTDRVGAAVAVRNGAPWTVERGRADNAPPEVLEAFAARASAFVETEGVAPAEQTVTGWRKEIVSGAKPHNTIRRVDELAKLREENKRLKAELSAAKKRIVALELEAQQSTKRSKKKAA